MHALFRSSGRYLPNWNQALKHPRILKVHALRRQPRDNWLKPFRATVKSQEGQDGQIQRIFETIGIKNKWCVEFGAWDGEHFSNTWSLINQHDWSSVQIEGNSEKAAELSARYSHRPDVHCLNRFVGFERGVDTLDDILSSTPCPTDLDFMSIDVDGNDWHIWDSLEVYKPRLLMIEFNQMADQHLLHVQERRFDLNEGSSLAAFVALGKEKGYELIGVDTDAFFVHTDLLPLFDIEDNSLSALFNPAEIPYLMSGYDGSIIVAGNAMLTWQGMELAHDDIQVLPQSARKRWWID
jgi:hypothetical protein